MKLFLALALLMVSSTCFAGTTTHHWFSKVPVKQTNPHAKKVKGFNYKAKPATSRRGSNSTGQPTLLTRILHH
jgi:hypothetical protein